MRPVKCVYCKKFFDADKYEMCPHCNDGAGEFPQPPVVKPAAPVVVQCESCKKFYDANVDSSCPHCAGPELPYDEEPVAEEPAVKEEAGGIVVVRCELCGKFYDANSDKVCPHCKGITEELPEKEEQDEPFEEENKNEPGPVVAKCELCNKFYDASMNSVCPHCNGVTEELPEAETAEEELAEEKIEEAAAEEKIEEAPAQEPAAEEIPEEKAAVEPVAPVSISEAVKQADSVQSNDAIERFVDEKTVAFYNLSNDVEPVVGWLVGLKGEYKGVSFTLKSGRNYIGRSLNMDVALAKENTVSRDRHSIISFDPKQKKFFIQSGESRGLTYVNGELLMSFREINIYDVISLGACDLMFVPLCTDRFSWENIR